MVQTYQSLSDFISRHSLSLPKPRDWWLISQPQVGEINGLGRLFRGKAVATNGILVAIESVLGVVVIGHRDWFLPDKDESIMPSPTATKRVRRTPDLEKILALVEL